ncbi:MAG TPA: glycine cleavage system aminomethyltransferase GcvT [Spirochaetia bacterium]|nr:glycine cleavage system aminomethyltransferase GcvT [Spirochaetia bacterium]
MDLQRTPLYDVHRRLGAKMVGFGGWEMPVQYTGIAAEHQAVRERAGLFDASHMGEILVSGAGAAAFVQWAVTADAGRAAVGQVIYSPVCLASGGVLDDILVYRLAEEDYLLVVNAGNKDKDLAWLLEEARGRANLTVADQSADWALLALQGPLAATILARLTRLDDLRYYWSRRGVVAGVPCLVSRTGYTGEDGFELYCPPDKAARLCEELLAAGKADGLVPAGLGARDTLRLEAALPLYGNELNEETSPLEAGLDRFVSFAKGDFSGREALWRQKEVARKLAGFELTVPGIARHGYTLALESRAIGTVTSGTLSPTLGRAIGLGYVAPELATPGTDLAVVIRGRECAARVVATPFYRRGGKK